jgi:hypothetical protein
MVPHRVRDHPFLMTAWSPMPCDASGATLDTALG